MTRVLALLPVIGHPRDSKRIDMLLAEGFEIEAGAFVRSYPMNRVPRCEVTELGRIEDGRYIERAITTLRCLPRIISLVRRNDLIYASGQDMALIALFARLNARKPVIMEVGDLRQIQVASGPKGAIMRALDRYIANNVALIVTTSERYVTEYYTPLLGKIPDYITVENKLDANFTHEIEQRDRPRSEGEAEHPSTLRIGYFGVLRFQWCIDVLFEIVKSSNGLVRVLLAGFAAKGVDLSRLLALPGVEYVPHYRSPDDLASLYDRVDMVWGCYPASSGEPSARVGRTNRFYESCLFGKPMFVLAGTGDAQAVETLGIGPTIPSEDVESALATVSSVTIADRRRWREALDRLPRTVYSYSDEQPELARRLREALVAARNPSRED